MQHRIDASEQNLKEKLVYVNRVAKVVSGGRNFRFSALVVVGDENGHVGCGMGKAAEIPEAIRKAVEQAKKDMIFVPVVGTTVPHECIGKFGRGQIVILPSSKGSGIIAGNHARAVFELAGVRDVKAKSYGSNNPINTVKATIEGLKQMKTKEQYEKLRGVTIDL